MATALSEELHQEARPPVATHVAPLSGRRGRPSMQVRPLITAVTLAAAAPFRSPRDHDPFDVRDLYVRRYWTAVLGPGAIADLLRLAQAAKDGRRIRLPHSMPTLLAEDLVHRLTTDCFGVPGAVKHLDRRQLSRLPPPLRRAAARYRS